MFSSHCSGLLAPKRETHPSQTENVLSAAVRPVTSVYIQLTLSDHLFCLFPKGEVSQRERYLTYPIGYFRPPALISTKNSYKIDGPLPSPFVDHSLASSANLLIQDEVFHLWVDFSPSIK